jgi:GxxExxY protein
LEPVLARSTSFTVGYRSNLTHYLFALTNQAELIVGYKGIEAGKFYADFLVDGKIIVEMKATKGLTEVDEAQLLNYLKGTGYRVGLLLNFGTASLEYKRRIL